jgi:hypothetical protein
LESYFRYLPSLSLFHSFLFSVQASFFPSISYFSSSLCKAFSRDQSSFFSSGEVEKKLVFEMNHLKAELVIEQVDLEVERQGHQNSEGVHTQVAKLEKAKKGHPGCFKRSI